MTAIDRELWAKCSACGRVWLVCSLPQPMRALGKLLKDTTCTCSATSTGIGFPTRAEIERERKSA